MKLEIKHLSPYLPYNLKGQCLHKTIDGVELKNNVFVLDSIDQATQWIYWTHDRLFLRQLGLRGKGFRPCDFKPLLRPLSDYVNINSDAMMALNCDVSTQINLNEFAMKYISLSSLYYSTYEICLINHIDVFGLIDEGLALPLI